MNISILRVFDTNTTDKQVYKCIVQYDHRIVIKYLSFDEIHLINTSNGHKSPLAVEQYTANTVSRIIT